MNTTLGVIIGNRGFFPSKLCEEGRATILKVLKEDIPKLSSKGVELVPVSQLVH